MNTWFTADDHFNHGNIIKYCNRPFKNVEEMNETIISKHNARVDDDDIVFDLGDFMFRNSPGGKPGEGKQDKSLVFLRRLKGRRINVKGNHDRNNSLKTCIEKIYIRYGGYDICLVHNPAHADPKCELNLVGHVHSAWKIKRLNAKSIMINVGVDVHNFSPISFDEIQKCISQFKKEEKNGNSKATEERNKKSSTTP